MSKVTVRRSGFLVLVAFTSAVLAAHRLSPTSRSAEAIFLAENRAAMEKMMSGMSVDPSGYVDRDFAAMMIPHHQGAIDMARAELRHGRNEQLRRIAQEIIVEQEQEITVMRLAVGPTLPTSKGSPEPTK